LVELDREGLRKCQKVAENQSTSEFFLNDKDLEYPGAACMLHNIGLYLGKKGYHKQSCGFIMVGYLPSWLRFLI